MTSTSEKTTRLLDARYLKLPRKEVSFTLLKFTRISGLTADSRKISGNKRSLGSTLKELKVTT